MLFMLTCGQEEVISYVWIACSGKVKSFFRTIGGHALQFIFFMLNLKKKKKTLNLNNFNSANIYIYTGPLVCHRKSLKIPLLNIVGV